ncbi:MAG: pilus assembly protein PilP [Bacteriovorax sp.]|jgi:type IV pilus assembly protein PilP
MKALKIIILIMLLTISAFAQESANSESTTAVKLFKGKTYVKGPLDLRDPFKRRINKKKGTVDKAKINESGIYSNQSDRIEDKPVESIRIIGVMIGKERRAMAKIATGKTLAPEIYFIKEGMKIGPNGAEVKAILPGGIVLVEKIRNVYDQDEYLETVLPVSNE